MCSFLWKPLSSSWIPPFPVLCLDTCQVLSYISICLSGVTPQAGTDSLDLKCFPADTQVLSYSPIHPHPNQSIHRFSVLGSLHLSPIFLSPLVTQEEEKLISLHAAGQREEERFGFSSNKDTDRTGLRPYTFGWCHIIIITTLKSLSSYSHCKGGGAFRASSYESGRKNSPPKAPGESIIST